MGYQTGTIGPINYHQDNSGDSTDTDTSVNYTPQQFGAPPGAQIITGLVQQNYHVTRGNAYVHNKTVTADAISFDVFTQAANDGLFGWHSGAIDVSTTFAWYYITNSALEGGEPFFVPEGPAVHPNS